ncbi:MAG TPA: DUF3592 domain-containing protein [Candidatus Acidoferrales bacterium]|nr:DUF3592 domain-containing protein [Candidatus Acidoferrales bacterium]
MQTDYGKPPSDPREYATQALVKMFTGLSSNPARRRRAGAGAQILAGTFLLVFGYWIGRDHCRLVVFGMKTQGKLVGYHQATIPTGQSGSNFYDTESMPVIEYHAAGRTVRFQDWMGSNFRVPMGGIVPVLYDPTRPTNAMIDRPVANWIPWGPMMAVGLLLMISGIRGRFGTQSPEEANGGT